jgi:hypothetical protein
MVVSILVLMDKRDNEHRDKCVRYFFIFQKSGHWIILTLMLSLVHSFINTVT